MARTPRKRRSHRPKNISLPPLQDDPEALKLHRELQYLRVAAIEPRRGKQHKQRWLAERARKLDSHG